MVRQARSQHLSLISLYIAVVKRITSICFVLSAALPVSLQLRAADVQTVVVTSSSVKSSVVLLQAELAGKETAFSCVTDSPLCSAAPVGEYVMVKAKDAEGIYEDCTNVILYRSDPSTKNKVGVYCWLNSDDCYMVSCTPVQVHTVPSSVPIDTVGQASASGHDHGQKPTYVVYQVSADVMAPKPISTPMPPPDSINRQLKVRVSFVVAPDGSVADVRLLNRSKTALDGYAIATVHSWRFEPAKRHGQAVAVRLETEMQSHR